MGSPAVARARAALGTRFRLGGRDPASGLDCVGLVAWARQVTPPVGYALRTGDAARITAWCDARWRRGTDLAGAVLLFAAGPGTLHLALGTGAGLIHADIALRRVAERPGAAPWPLIAAWEE